MKVIRNLVASFSFCVGIGMDQLTPEFKTIHWFEMKSFNTSQKTDVRLIKPKMFHVKPQPFSVQIKKR